MRSTFLPSNGNYCLSFFLSFFRSNSLLHSLLTTFHLNEFSFGHLFLFIFHNRPVIINFLNAIVVSAGFKLRPMLRHTEKKWELRHLISRMKRKLWIRCGKCVDSCDVCACLCVFQSIRSCGRYEKGLWPRHIEENKKEQKQHTHTAKKMLYLMNDHRWKGQNVNWWDMYSGQWSWTDWPMVVFGSWSFVFNNPFTTCVCTSFPLTIFYSLFLLSAFFCALVTFFLFI